MADAENASAGPSKERGVVQARVKRYVRSLYVARNALEDCCTMFTTIRDIESFKYVETDESVGSLRQQFLGSGSN